MMARVPLTAYQVNAGKFVLNAESVGLSPEQFYQLCRDNPDLRIEFTARREIEIMSPTNSKTGYRSAEICRQLGNWAVNDGRGVFDSNAGFTLPNGAKRAPDASWIPHQRWSALTPEDQETIAPICPDFVIELWSPGDAIPDLQAKLEEYIANGARLGFLIDPKHQHVYVYRPGRLPERLDQPRSVSGDPELPGFTLELTEIWK